MGEQIIEVLIAPDGSVKMEGQGFSGPECERAMGALEQSLGRVVDSERTPEYYNEAKAKASY